MFEPVHGSAPDIAGTGIANPIGQIWSSCAMLDHPGRSAPAGRLMEAVEDVLEGTDFRTPDFGGRSKTTEVAQAIVDRLAACGWQEVPASHTRSTLQQ